MAWWLLAGSSSPRPEVLEMKKCTTTVMFKVRWAGSWQVLKQWPEFRPIHIHSRRVFRHGLTLLETQALL